MEAYSVCQLQPDPGFSDENNYLTNVVAEEYHRDFTEELPRATLINKDGIDVTGKVSSFQNESPVLDRHGGHGKNDGEDLPQGQASDRCGGDGASALIAGSDVLQ